MHALLKYNLRPRLYGFAEISDSDSCWLIGRFWAYARDRLFGFLGPGTEIYEKFYNLGPLVITMSVVVFTNLEFRFRSRGECPAAYVCESHWTVNSTDYLVKLFIARWSSYFDFALGYPAYILLAGNMYRDRCTCGGIPFSSRSLTLDTAARVPCWWWNIFMSIYIYGPLVESGGSATFCCLVA